MKIVESGAVGLKIGVAKNDETHGEVLWGVGMVDFQSSRKAAETQRRKEEIGSRGKKEAEGRRKQREAEGRRKQREEGRIA